MASPSTSTARAATRTFELTDKQVQLRDAAASSARHILAYGGSRSGKTFGFCYCIAVRALSAPASRHLIARLHNIDVRQAVMMDTWPKMMRLAFPGVKYATNKADQFITLPDESEVWFGGLDDKERVDKILGKEFATVYVNEASQVAYDTVQTLRTRLAQACKKRNGSPLALKGYYDLNPTGKAHWTYREFVEGVRPENGLKLTAGSRAHVILNPKDNPHLPAEYLDVLDDLPDRARQRFRDGNYLTEVPGALWPMDVIERNRVSPDRAPDLVRIVVAIDPSGGDGAGNDMQGIVAAGLGVDGDVYVLRDASCKLTPHGWGGRAVRLYHELEADLIVAEVNFGGAMVESTVRAVDNNVSYRSVSAARGKHVRAEPVAALYEKGRVHHVCTPGEVNPFSEMEEEMGLMTTTGYQGGGSPNRLDAMVWAVTELVLAESVAGAAFLELARRDMAKPKPEPETPLVQAAPGSLEWLASQTGR